MPVVYLPRCELIAPSELAVSIANAIHLPRSTRQGIECIKSKQMVIQIPSNNEPGTCTTWKAPLLLSEDERDLITSQLDKLPSVHGAMRNHQRDKFLREFRRLNPTLGWTPLLDIEPDSEWEKEAREISRSQHLAMIRQAISVGKLLTVNADWTPAKHIGALLPITQAKIYLELCGLECNEPPSGGQNIEETVPIKRGRRSAFDSPLDEAITACQGSHEHLKVWHKLKDMAMNNQSGLSYDSEDATSAKQLNPDLHSIGFTDRKGQIARITSGAVRKRLERRIRRQ